jgi:hypothetical protein
LRTLIGSYKRFSDNLEGKFVRFAEFRQQYAKKKACFQNQERKVRELDTQPADNFLRVRQDLRSEERGASLPTRLSTVVAAAVAAENGEIVIHATLASSFIIAIIHPAGHVHNQIRKSVAIMIIGA